MGERTRVLRVSFEAAIAQRNHYRERCEDLAARLAAVETERDEAVKELHRIAFSAGGKFELIETLREIARTALEGGCPHCRDGVPRFNASEGYEFETWAHQYGGDPGTIMPCTAAPFAELSQLAHGEALPSDTDKEEHRGDDGRQAEADAADSEEAAQVPDLRRVRPAVQPDSAQTEVRDGLITLLALARAELDEARQALTAAEKKADEYRIEADCCMRDYDGLEVDLGEAKEREQKLIEALHKARQSLTTPNDRPDVRMALLTIETALDPSSAGAARAALPVAARPEADACYCGHLDWTIKTYGRLAHKHGCPARTDTFCQSHPDGCPVARPEADA